MTWSQRLSRGAAERALKEMYLVAYIHEQNRASRAFAERFGMDKVTKPDNDGYVLHSVTLAFAEME